jgi:tRNA A37 threonylcarbamoyladenosine synthetase subunit TsaC/SUA5/YrdC
MTSPGGIKRLRALSGSRDEGHFTLLCAGMAQFGDLCVLDNSRFRLIKGLTPGPYVFILRTLLGTEKALGLRRKEIGVRIPDHPVPLALLRALGRPLYSITAKRGGYRDLPPSAPGRPVSRPGREAGPEESWVFPEEALFDEAWELELLEGIDIIFDPGEERPRIFSSILDLTAGEVRVLRAGAGVWPR